MAVVTDGHEARAYLCDSVSVSVWFGAALDGKAFAADSEGISLQGLVSAGSVRGTVTLPDGTAHRFTAAKTTRTGKAGLFRGELVQDGKTYVGGWIVLPSLKVRGFVEQDNIVVTHVPSSGSGIIAILIGRRALDLPGIGTLQITDGTSNTRR